MGDVVAGFGLGLDIAGAVFLGLALFESPTGIASRLFVPFERPPTKYAKRPVSTRPVAEAALAVLSGRVGLVSLTSGFVAQVVALALPSAQFEWWAPLAAAAIAVVIAQQMGKRWISRRQRPLERAIWRAPRLSEVVDLDDMRRQPDQRPWPESKVLVWLRKRFHPRYH